MIRSLNRWRKSDDYGDYDDDMLVGLGYIFSVFIIALGIGLIIGNMFGIIKNVCMPEMAIYEYITNIQ